jgi:hypothetical protein
MLEDCVLDQNCVLADTLSIEEAKHQWFGDKVSTHTLRRWIAKGVGAPKIKLKAVRIGGRYFLRRRDVEEFVAATKDPELYRRHQLTIRAERAKRRLIAAGA